MDDQFIDPFAAADWDLIPGHTALVLIDLQNDFLHPEGWYAKSGVDISHMRRVIDPTLRLLDEVRRRGVPVIWTRHGFRGQHDGGILFKLRPFMKHGGLRKDTWGHKILDVFTPSPDDWFVDKSRLSAFYATDLELILRGLGTQTVLIAGVLTNQCVNATAKDASFRDFLPVMVEDCTGTTLPHLHEPAVEMMKVGWGAVRDLEASLEELQRFPLANAPHD